uniref:Ubiquitin carboxyl-terminal hydrolase 42-like n=1 Tax=Cyanistes caeruleus TaxID=156563 RepID=A0A8C0UKY9_CYACU
MKAARTDESGWPCPLLGLLSSKPMAEICLAPPNLNTFKDLSQTKRPGAGLFNLGNTCYINVILQCLTYTPPLANYLLSYEHSQSCQQQGFCMMCTMEAHVRKLLNSFLVIGEELPGLLGGRSGAFQHLAVCLVSRCRRKAAASKVVTVHRAPRVLTLCLERADQWTGTKISKFVEYPEYLDLRPYMSDRAGEPLLCSLYAIVVHSGDTCLEGHFLCYTKASNGLWYKMDDESVDNCDIHTVLGQQAYLLFYAR